MAEGSTFFLLHDRLNIQPCNIKVCSKVHSSHSIDIFFCQATSLFISAAETNPNPNPMKSSHK